MRRHLTELALGALIIVVFCSGPIARRLGELSVSQPDLILINKTPGLTFRGNKLITNTKYGGLFFDAGENKETNEILVTVTNEWNIGETSGPVKIIESILLVSQGPEWLYLNGQKVASILTNAQGNLFVKCPKCGHEICEALP